jgi:phosphoglycerol transferase MdoB-like AlkP superfamily enzyme
MDGDELDNYINQSVCGLRKVSQFLDTLKKLGRFDNSIIILHSDTGVGDFGYITNLDQKAVASDITKSPLIPQSRWREAWVQARTAAILAIKPPSNQQPFQENPKATQLIDIAPTLFAVLGVKGDQLPGSNLLADEAQKTPVTSFFWPGSEPDTVRSFDTYQPDQPLNLQPYKASN